MEHLPAEFLHFMQAELDTMVAQRGFAANRRAGFRPREALASLWSFYIF
jgi:hypothetical protein